MGQGKHMSNNHKCTIQKRWQAHLISMTNRSSDNVPAAKSRFRKTIPAIPVTGRGWGRGAGVERRSFKQHGNLQKTPKNRLYHGTDYDTTHPVVACNGAAAVIPALGLNAVPIGPAVPRRRGVGGTVWQGH